MSIKQKKLNQLDIQIIDRKDYLAQIERDIELATTEGNNQLLLIRGELDGLDREKARLMKLLYSLEQDIRDKRHIVESLV